MRLAPLFLLLGSACMPKEPEPAFGVPYTQPENTEPVDEATSSPGSSTGHLDPMNGSSSESSSTSEAGSEAGDDSSSSGGSDSDPATLDWLFDLETGMVAPSKSSHDGADVEAAGCAEVEDAFTVAGDQPVHSGDFSLGVHFERAWLEDNPDCTTVRAFFSQSSAVQIEEGREYWHGWAIYVPDEPGDSWTTARWATAGQANKALSVDLLPDLTWRFRATQIGSGDFDLTLSPDRVDFGGGETEVWHEFVAHFVITTEEDDGMFELWHRVHGDDEWTQVVSAQGRTANFAAEFPFMIRHGLHSGHAWGNAESDSKSLFFDEVRFVDGDEGQFEDVVPGGMQ